MSQTRELSLWRTGLDPSLLCWKTFFCLLFNQWKWYSIFLAIWQQECSSYPVPVFIWILSNFGFSTTFYLLSTQSQPSLCCLHQCFLFIPVVDLRQQSVFQLAFLASVSWGHLDYRCFPGGLGDLLQNAEGRVAMGRKGQDTAYELPGIHSISLAIKVVFPISLGATCSGYHGQHCQFIKSTNKAVLCLQGSIRRPWPYALVHQK